MSLAKIGTNVQSLQALSQFNRTNNDLGARQLRLATGSRINSAADDSAGFTIAKKLESKVRGQAQALSNIGDAKGMLNVGEGTLNSVMDILQTMKEKAVQAGNATMGEDELAAIQSQMNALVAEIDDVLGGAEFNGVNLFAGSEVAGEDDGDDPTTGPLSLSFQVGAGAEDTFDVKLAALSTATIFGTTEEGEGDDAESVPVKIDVTTAAVAADEDGEGAEASGASKAITAIDAAIATVSKATADIGDAQNRLSFKADNLETSKTNYEASLSGIKDADFAQESMEIAKLQILQQTGIASLAQANVSSQAVLSLIG